MFTRLKYYIKQYFGFSRGQTYGVALLLLLLATTFLIAGLIHQYDIHKRKKELLVSAVQLDALLRELEQISTKKSQSHQSPGLHRRQASFDINTTDEHQLKQLYGIGAVRSKRILTYRTRLGGFVDRHQYNEINNLPPEVIAILYNHTFIHPHFVPQKINLNTASISVLASHPYISWKQAKIIFAYRDQHGRFQTIEELKNVRCFDPTTLDKILPYLTITH